MAKKSKTKVVQRAPIDPRQLLATWLVALGLLIFIGGGWVWYQYVHRSVYSVFWDTVDNNFRITGVTRTVEQIANGAEVKSKLQVSLGAENLARGLTTIKQTGDNGTSTTIITETLGTSTNNYARYVDINVVGAGKQPDISSIKNAWSRELLVKGAQQNQSVLAEGLFSSVPFANLTQPQRQEIVQFMKDNDVYTVDYRGATVVERAGKQAYEYKVAVSLKGYIATLKKIDAMMGLGQLDSVDPNSYEGAEPANLTIVNSIDGRQLLEVTYTGASRKEEYSSYGARINVDVPETELLRSDLEQKVQNIFKPAGAS